ncbi:hypothetical protein H5410_036538 [Solanum commersonii]|uniref:Uncharacterized protein n=1 Tax=Solanum commersonii TaxID=4109 RepID=A0A9J5Y5K8_SOLCO|nr:hypothetical protein H5410_036538 [Solanum commersonii]
MDLINKVYSNISLTMDVYVTLRFHHGGKLQQKRLKEIGYNCSSCVVYIKPPKCRCVVEVKSDRDIMGIVHQLKNRDIVELYVTHLVEKVVVPPPQIGYLNDVGGESNATFDKESSQTFEGSEGLGFQEAVQLAQPEEPIGRASVSVGEDLGGTFSAADAYDIPEVGSDWESETEASDDSDNADLSDEGEDEYGSDIHKEVINLKKEKRAAKIEKRKEKGPRSEEKQTTFEGKIAGDEPYFDSDEAVSFEIDTDEDVNGEDEIEQPTRRQRKARRAKRNKKKVVFDPTYQLIVWETGLAFESVKQFREVITRCAVQEHVELDKYVNDATRNYNPVHKCNGTTKNKLVNSKYLLERYKDRIISEPGIRVFQFQILVKKELNVYVGRTVARKARNIVLKQIMGDHVEEFKRILDYRDELLKTNQGSICVVRLSEETFEGGRKMFQSFYICFNALKKAFKAGARRCIGFDGCFLKGVSRGQLLVALVRHDLELGDGTELTTITDMQKGLDKAIEDLLPNTEQRIYCDSVDNDMAESFNSWILGPKHKIIITMLEDIKIKVMRRIGQLREFCDTWITNISPMALKRGVEMACSLCHAKGHNKRGCYSNNQANAGRERGNERGHETSSTRSSVGSSRAPTESQSSTKRASATGRGRGTATGNRTGIGVAADGSGANGMERGTGVAATANDVPGATGGGKSPRMVGMGILHTQSGFTIHNPGMPMNSSVVTGNLGHHKPRSGLKWKGKATVTQEGLQEMRENKRMRTRSNAAELIAITTTQQQATTKKSTFCHVLLHLFCITFIFSTSSCNIFNFIPRQSSSCLKSPGLSTSLVTSINSNAVAEV